MHVVSIERLSVRDGASNWSITDDIGKFCVLVFPPDVDAIYVAGVIQRSGANSIEELLYSIRG